MQKATWNVPVSSR